MRHHGRQGDPQRVGDEVAQRHRPPDEGLEPFVRGTVGQEHARKKYSRRADPGRVWIAEMQKAENRRGENDTPE